MKSQFTILIDFSIRLVSITQNLSTYQSHQYPYSTSYSCPSHFHSLSLSLCLSHSVSVRGFFCCSNYGNKYVNIHVLFGCTSPTITKVMLCSTCLSPHPPPFQPTPTCRGTAHQAGRQTVGQLVAFKSTEDFRFSGENANKNGQPGSRKSYIA